MAISFEGKVFFYLVPHSTPETEPYQHIQVSLAEGLKQLGIEFYSNINYWKLSPERDDYLFCHHPDIGPDDCQVVVMNDAWFELANKPFPDRLFHPRRTYITVYSDNTDGCKTQAWNDEFRQFDIILRTHYSRKFHYPDNFYPWAFGLSKRILDQLSEPVDFMSRKKQIVSNFRTRQFEHSVRKQAKRNFLPRIQAVLEVDRQVDSFAPQSLDAFNYLQWSQTGRRHYPSYYQRLQESVACACFGGFFMSPWPTDQSAHLSRLFKRVLSKTPIVTNQVIQWDSWRFWEALAAGCVAFHIDLEHYGCQLPEMPEGWTHYVPVNLRHPEDAIARIIDEPDILARIAEQGRQWAIANYAPLPTAIRFLNLIT